MIKDWTTKDYRGVLKRLLLVGTCIALPAIAWAQWTTSGNNIYSSNSGNVGIGTTSPGAKFDVNGYIRILDDSGGRLVLGREDNTFEGGQITWNAPGAYYGWEQDVFQNKMRFYSYSSGAQQVQILSAGGGTIGMYVQGNVGIGTATPSSALDVNGDVTVSGNISAKYQDVAEWVSTTYVLPAGTVVALDTESDNGVVPSSAPYDTHVAGVVSDSPGIILGVAGPGKLKIATTGRVKVHVDASNGPIRRGDLLVTGTKVGTAMRSEPMEFAGRKIHQPGTLIGKALEPLSDGEGEILVLLSLQ